MTSNEIRNNIKLDNINWKHIFTTNCYAFALKLDINERKIMKDAYQPGTMSGNYLDRYFTYEQLMESIYQDLDYLDIEYKEIDPLESISSNEWKIAVFIDLFRYTDDKILLSSDFHFLRQIDNNWYRKPRYISFPTSKDSYGVRITDPTKCRIYGKAYQKTYSLKLKKN